ncbi:LytR/AlgR family response regulator transcription factor [Winogradskyella sp. A2]|uniref:LytR/AlgR family response regulator transcription factor n=1 Tax=Winogradskyella sp. A2 TaxID=3366944 RepID=UPI00398C7754
MKKDTLYFLTFISIFVVVCIIAFLSVGYFSKLSTNKLIETQFESGIRESKEIASFINTMIDSGISADKAKNQIQQILKDTDTQTSFVSVFDWSGKTICHPDITQLNSSVASSEPIFGEPSADVENADYYDMLYNGGTESDTKIMHIVPVKNIDWIVASNINLNQVTSHYDAIKNRFYLSLFLMALSIILLSFFLVRMIGVRYEKALELKNLELQSELISLTKLNMDLADYKVRRSEQQSTTKVTTEDNDNKRLLTNRRNEIVPISVNDIAYIFTENTITYIVCKDGQKSTINESLEEIYKNLDEGVFFRANRKTIIELSSIDKILKYGNSQLKIVTNPESSSDIIISKNKAADFKRWLNKQ